jgi:hypothetical protein
MRELVFTFVVDYKGGTYVSQVPARTVCDAIAAWTRVANWQAMRIRVSESFAKRLERELGEDTPVLIEGMTNVWCISPLLAGAVATVTIVATVKSRCPVARLEQPR